MPIKHIRNIQFLTLQFLVVAIAIIFIFISILVGKFDIEKQQSKQRLSVLAELTTIGNRLEGIVRSTFNLTQGMVHLIRFQGGMGREQFDTLCKMAMHENKYIRNIAFAPNNKIEMVYPYSGNEKALGLKYLENEEQKGSVIKAMALQQPVLAGPVRLLQGGTGLINRSPVFIRKEHDGASEYWGLISIVAYHDSILKDGGVFASKDLKIAMQGKDGNGAEALVFFGDSAVLGQNPVIVDVAVPGGKWRLMAVPNGGWTSDLVFRSHYFIFSIVLTVMFVLLLTVLISVNQNINNKNHQLALEINERKRVEVELKKSKEQAEEANRVKTAFLANMSHEIRTPMNAIQGFTEILMKGDISQEMTREYTEIVNSSSKQLLGVINDIIDVSMIEAGQLKIINDAVNINKLLKNIYNLHSNSALTKELDFRVRCGLSDGADSIISDENRLFQVINNLVSNAIKFTSKGFVEFGYSVGENRLTFFVKDTGIGVPEKFHRLIFDRFRQVDDKLSRNYGGTGLGLSICKSIAELMNGNVWIESEPNIGSIFYFTIPYTQGCQQVAESGATSSQNIVELSNKTILIAEDDNLNFLLLKKLIEKTDARIIRASNGLEALEILSSNRVDLILMDIKMPIMNGYEAISKIRERNIKIPIITQTAYAMTEERQQAFKSGSNFYITKPINHKELFDILRQIFS